MHTGEEFLLSGVFFYMERVKKMAYRRENNRALAYRYKKMMDDIISYTYTNHPSLNKMKAYTIECYPTEYKSKLGECFYNTAGYKHSTIKIYAIQGRTWERILITVIHETTHHIDYVIRGKSAHDKEFYKIHVRLLTTALDMGILSYEGVMDYWKNTSRSARKLAGMMEGYIPHPINYKSDIVTIYVYGGYSVKDSLKERGYMWSSTDSSWFREITNSELAAEQDFLKRLGVSEENIETSGFKGVTNIRKTIVRLYCVPYEEREKVKAFAYRWNKEGKFWFKSIDENDIPREERQTLSQIDGIDIKIIW